MVRPSRDGRPGSSAGNNQMSRSYLIYPRQEGLEHMPRRFNTLQTRPSGPLKRPFWRRNFKIVMSSLKEATRLQTVLASKVLNLVGSLKSFRWWVYQISHRDTSFSPQEDIILISLGAIILITYGGASYHLRRAPDHGLFNCIRQVVSFSKMTVISKGSVPTNHQV